MEGLADAMAQMPATPTDAGEAAHLVGGIETLFGWSRILADTLGLSCLGTRITFSRERHEHGSWNDIAYSPKTSHV